VDASGLRVVSDTSGTDPATGGRRIHLVIGTLTGGANPLLKTQWLLDTRTSGKDQPMHPVWPIYPSHLLGRSHV